MELNLTRPILSIGIPTYNREELLIRAFESIKSIGPNNIEILIGNNYVSKKISFDQFNLKKPNQELKIFNHQENLGAIANFNFLLDKAQGEYFIWLCDDDYYLPGFFDILIPLLNNNSHSKPEVIFPKYILSSELKKGIQAISNSNNVIEYLKSPEYLKFYLQGKYSVLGLYGVYKKSYLLEKGGMIQMGTSPSGLYSDNRLAILAGVDLNKIAYINFPQIVFNDHDDSCSTTLKDLIAYQTGQKDLLNEILPLVKDHKISGKNIEGLIRFYFIPHHLCVQKRLKSISIPGFFIFLKLIITCVPKIGFHSFINIIFDFLKLFLKGLVKPFKTL